ncbi:hypothetical protein B0O99DRAFT_663765 [Bisporella sp. PMI_857]|nr:hypothetical protein B0O99DRAFT_663765 [Bisporella sp. PMI_857]
MPSHTALLELALRDSRYLVSLFSIIESIIPQTNVTLRYASVNETEMTAWVNATMKYPSVLLEDIDSITKVDCSTSSVDITFGNTADYEESFATWPSSSFLLFTNHLGDCDTENERGLYVVSRMDFNNDTLTVTASTEKSTFDASCDEMEIAFTKPSSTTTSKREVTQTFLGDFPGTLSLSDSPTTTKLSISVESPSLGGSLAVSGHLHYSWFHLKPTSFYVDIDLSLSASANVKVVAGLAYDNDVYTFSPASVSVSAFSIPGILDVGPRLEFSLGVEVAVSGEVDISADLSATIADGNIHLDLLDSDKTTTSGWKPVYTHETNISATIEAQVNPFVALTAAIGVDFLSGLLDLSAGVTAKPTLINVFTVNGEFDISNTANVTLPAPTETTCVNGLWFSSAFAFIVDAFVTQFYTVELYRLDVPIYESGCWSWAPGAINGSS